MYFSNFLTKIEPSKITPFSTTIVSASREGGFPVPLIRLCFYITIECFAKNFNKQAKFILKFAKMGGFH